MGALLSLTAFVGMRVSASEEPAPPAPAPVAPVTTPAPAAQAPEKTAETAAPAAPAASPDEPKATSSREALESSEGEGAKPIVMAGVPSFTSLKSLPASQDVLAKAREEDGHLVLDTPEGKKTLTINPALQKNVTELLKRYRIPYGAVTAIDPRTGKVLALSEWSQEQPNLRGLNLKAIYPAASVFKVVTGAALLDSGVSPDETVCYHGGHHRIQKRLLEDNKRTDGRCITLADAMSHSANVVFGKLAMRSLDAKKLQSWANRFGFNTPVPFAEPAEASAAAIPEDEFEFATTAAGFGKVFLTPLHGAVMAGALGTRGTMVTPVLFEGEETASKQILDKKLADTIADMLQKTVTEGTGRQGFRERGRYALSVPAAGKTGTLASSGPFHEFSWFIGWAPKDNPTIAVAAVMVNGLKWTVRAPYVVRETMRMYLDPPTPKKKPAAVAAKAKKKAVARKGVASR